MAIRLLIWKLDNMVADFELEQQENAEKKFEKEREFFEKKINFLEEYWSGRMRRYYELSNMYYKILSQQICWKSVEEWMKEDKKVVYSKKESKWKKSSK